ncbi:MAG: hypothetical protein ACI4WS_04235 [Oscillospiraceae bacterium]
MKTVFPSCAALAAANASVSVPVDHAATSSTSERVVISSPSTVVYSQLLVSVTAAAAVIPISGMHIISIAIDRKTASVLLSFELFKEKTPLSSRGTPFLRQALPPPPKRRNKRHSSPA